MRPSFLVLSLGVLAFTADADVSSAISSSIIAIPDSMSSLPVTSAPSSTGGEVHSTASASANSTSTATRNGVGVVTGEVSGIAALMVGIAAWLV